MAPTTNGVFKNSMTAVTFLFAKRPFFSFLSDFLGGDFGLVAGAVTGLVEEGLGWMVVLLSGTAVSLVESCV